MSAGDVVEAAPPSDWAMTGGRPCTVCWQLEHTEAEAEDCRQARASRARNPWARYGA